MVVELKLDSKCQYPHCKEAAVVVAHDSFYERVETFCRVHADWVVKYHRPEYVEECPNCGCEFGVN